MSLKNKTIAKNHKKDEEIIVTAQHRQQSIQNVPIALSALSGSELAHRHVNQLVDLGHITTGLSATNATSGGTPIFSIRGIGLDDFNPNQLSGVATYIDDIAVSNPEILSGQMFDVNRVEVLKGPQGTLYGRNATGGAINIYSRMPTKKTEGYMNVGYGRWNTLDTNGAVGGAITDKLTGRIAATYTRSFTGWQTDEDTGRKFGMPNRFGSRALLKYQISSNFHALLNLHYNQDRSILPSPQSEGNEATLGQGASENVDTGTRNPSKVRVGSLTPRYNNKGGGASLRLAWDLPFASIISASGWDKMAYRSVDNNDGMPGPTYDFFQKDNFNQFYQEVRANSHKGLFNGLIDWGAGVSFSHDRVHGMDSSDQSAPFIGIYQTPMDFTSNNLSIAKADYKQTRNAFGIFGNTEMHLTKKLSLIAGIRYSRDEVNFHGISTENGLDDGGIMFKGRGATVAQLDQSHMITNVSYRVGLNYKPVRRVMLYATVSSAYKSGAYYASPALDPAAWGYVKPEKLTDYEGGFKSSFFHNILQINGGIYYYNYKNRQSQLLFMSPASGLPVSSLGSIPKSNVFGQEFDVTVRPFTGFELNIGGNHLDTAIDRTATSLRGAPLYAEIPVGSSLAQAPRWSLLAHARYEAALTEQWNYRLQMDYSYSGKQAALLGDPNAIYGALQDLGASIGISSLGEKGWSFELWVRNLTNQSTNTYSFTSFYGGKTFYRQIPRSFGGVVGYKF